MADDGKPRSIGDTQRDKGKALTERALEVVERMRSEGRRVTFSAVAKEASVSRPFLYKNDAVRTAIEDAREDAYPDLDEIQLPDSLPEAYELVCEVQGRVLHAERELAEAKHDLEVLRCYIGKLSEQTEGTQ